MGTFTKLILNQISSRKQLMEGGCSTLRLTPTTRLRDLTEFMMKSSSPRTSERHYVDLRKIGMKVEDQHTVADSVVAQNVPFGRGGIMFAKVITNGEEHWNVRGDAYGA